MVEGSVGLFFFIWLGLDGYVFIFKELFDIIVFGFYELKVYNVFGCLFFY